MFEEAFTHISSANMFTILELNISREMHVLQLLFFSTSSDHKDKHLNTRLLKIKLKYKNQLYVHMKQLITLKIYKKITNYRTYRNEFLSKMSDDQYYQIFKMLEKHSHMFCFSWNHWMMLNHTVIKSMHKIMKHVMLWYSRSWRYSAACDNDLKTFN